MSVVEFFEKPGCIGNTHQKNRLTEAGHEVQAYDLRQVRWTPETLRPFFGGKPVSEWFHPSAHRIKSGEVDLDSLTPDQALAQLAADPMLIRRPLLRTAKGSASGFAPKDLTRLGLDLPAEEGDPEACARKEGESCSTHST